MLGSYPLWVFSILHPILVGMVNLVTLSRSFHDRLHESMTANSCLSSINPHAVYRLSAEIMHIFQTLSSEFLSENAVHDMHTFILYDIHSGTCFLL